MTTEATQDVFELVLARPVITGSGEHPGLVHLWWRAPLQGDRVVQVYVQDELYDVCLDTSAREMILVLDRTRSQRIELLAVPADDPDSVWRPQPGLLGAWQPRVSDVASVSLVRDETLPVETRIDVEVDGVVSDSGLMWSYCDNRSDPDEVLLLGDVAGLGLGIGGLGSGRLGYGGEALRWRRDDLEGGTHSIAVHAVDAGGQPVADTLRIDDVVIEHLPDPVVGLSIDESFGLTWS